MNWENLKKNEKALPEDSMLADLYALSRKIKGTEVNTTVSCNSINGESPRNFSNQFFMNAFGQISFMSPGCKIGQCCFCSYGASDVKLTPEIVAKEIDKFKLAILEKQKQGQNIYSILLDSVGSILDYNEFPKECLDVVFEKLNELLDEIKNIQNVIFETHYQTLGSYDEKGNYVASNAIEKLIEFKNKHPEIGTFIIELGFETANSELRDTLLFKHLDDETYKKSVKLLKENGIEVDVNVMATLPFLSAKEQISQSSESIIKALSPLSDNGYGIDCVTLFPLNVRKHTFCNYVFNAQEAYNKKHKACSPQWMKKDFPIWSMVATLNHLIEIGREDLLKKVSVAWFGGRGISKDNSEVYPRDWEETYDDFVLYRKNLSGENSRVNIIKRLAKHPKFIKFMEETMSENSTDLSYYDRAGYLHDLINEMNLPYTEESKCNAFE